VSDKVGLDPQMAARRLEQNGKNVISPPPKHLAKKIFFYIFGGEGFFRDLEHFFLNLGSRFR